MHLPGANGSTETAEPTVALHGRLILFGSFLGKRTRSKAKREFWVQSAIARRHSFKEIVLLGFCDEGDRKEYPEIRLEPISMFFRGGRIRPLDFFSGIRAMLALRTQNPTFLRDCIALERDSIPAPAGRGWRALPPQLVIAWICGLGRVWKLVQSLDLSSGDLAVMWNRHRSANRLFEWFCRRKRIPLLITENGELQGSVFVSERGMWHEAWPRLFPAEFRSLPVSGDDLVLAKTYLAAQRESRSSNKVYTRQWSEKEQLLACGKPVIYVNGVGYFGSGLSPRRAQISRKYSPRFATNAQLLDEVVRHARENDWIVLYKDHPNVFQTYPNLVVRRAHDPVLSILEDVDIHDVLDVADVTVTLGSKVAVLSLARNVPVVLAGPYTLDGRCPEEGIMETDRVGEGIAFFLQTPKAQRVNQEALELFVARMLRHYVYAYDEANLVFPKNRRHVWEDIQDYVAGRRSVVSTDALRRRNVDRRALSGIGR